LNLADNKLGELVLPEGWQETGYKKWTHSDGSEAAENTGKPAGIIAIANAIPDMGALLVLSLKGNGLRAEGGRALAELLKDNQVVTELNIADNDLCLNRGPDMSGIIALADVIPDMRALTSLNVANNKLGGLVDSASNSWTYSSNQWWCNSNTPPAGNKEGYKDAKPVGVILLANAIKDMRNISTVTVNTFPLPIQDIRSKAELDFSGKGLQVEDAIIIAALIPSNVSRPLFLYPCYHTDSPVFDKGAMTSLNLASDVLCAEGAKIIAAILPKCTYVAPSQRALYPLLIPQTDIPNILRQ
jgi:hypothetical protein